MVQCPICCSGNVQYPRFKPSELCDRWRQQYGLDVSDFISTTSKWIKCVNCGFSWFPDCSSGDSYFYSALSAHDGLVYYDVEKDEHAVVKEMFTFDSSNIVEIGCGNGTFLDSNLIDTVSRYVGYDTNSVAIESAKARFVKQLESGIINFHDDLLDFNILSDYDFILMFQVLEHLEQPSSFIQSIISSMRSGAKLIITVPNESSFLQHVSGDCLNFPPHHLTRWTSTSFKKMGCLSYNNVTVKCVDTVLEERHITFWLRALLSKWLTTKKPIVESRIRRIFLGALSRILTPVARLALSFGIIQPLGHDLIVIIEKS